MLSKWLARLNSSTESDPQDHRDVSLATALLLHEVAMADTTQDAVEIEQVMQEIVGAFGLTEAEAAALKRQSAVEAERTVSLHNVVATLNASLDGEGKRSLCARLWRVAFADGDLDPHEEGLIRKVADLLFIPHPVFVQEKLKAEAQAPGSSAA
jgi:uncharacterized tellurite resistance protein B-like protein